MAEVAALSPDIVILATGGMPELAQVSGAEELALSVWDVLSGDVVIGPNVLVYDETGGQSGPTVSTPYRIYRMLVHSLFACSAPRFQ